MNTKQDKAKKQKHTGNLKSVAKKDINNHQRARIAPGTLVVI
ncbi:MAG: hypothetical protein ACK5JF_09045 [Oscillospiraceae bacterium]